jgi:hypothetical protein
MSVYDPNATSTIQSGMATNRLRLPLFHPGAVLNAKRCWHIRASVSPCPFRETFVASLYGLRTAANPYWATARLISCIALGLGLGSIERRSNPPLAK